jgi:phospholipid/cholesterol/gamma-HCH transport system substrate-binding protein
METRANYALIGLFTLAVIAAAFGFVYWFSGGDRGQGRQSVRVVFSGSVSGLSRGSVVSFNGIRVGEVTDIRLLPEDPRRVVAVVQVENETPIRTDTRARLEYQGLTGVAQIGLSGGEPAAPPLTAGPGQPLPTIFADRSDFQDLMESARNIARRADDVLERVNKVITDNEGSINRTIQNVERFSDALGNNSAGIDRFLEQVGQAAEKVGPLAEKLETLATNVDGVVRAIDKEQVARIVSNVDQSAARLPAITENLQSLAGNLNNVAGAIDRDRVARIVENVDKGAERVPAIAEKFDRLATTASDRVGPLADKLDGLANDADAVIKAIDRNRVSRIVENVDGFTQTLNENRQVVNDALRDAASLVKQLSTTAPKLDAAISDVGNLAKAVDPQKIGRTVDNANKFAQALGNSSQDWEKTVAEARSISEKLNKSADRIDGVLAAAQNFLGTAAGPEGKSTFDEIRDAAKSVRDLANNLNERSTGLFAGLNRFSESGLREYEALAVEGRRTLADISRAVRSLERNPQQLIFGGGRSNVPEYNGRR